MNDHEAERIAAALHAARPDWPARSLLTLIRKNLLDRPRRDVFVALAWVASEPNTASPARVLEQGPWWRAAAVEGNTMRPDNWNPLEVCATCQKPQHRCRAAVAVDHPFVSVIDHERAVTGQPPRRKLDALTDLPTDERTTR